MWPATLWTWAFGLIGGEKLQSLALEKMEPNPSIAVSASTIALALERNLGPFQCATKNDEGKLVRFQWGDIQVGHFPHITPDGVIPRAVPMESDDSTWTA